MIRFGFSLFICISVVISACNQKNEHIDRAIEERFSIADSLVFAGKLDEGVQMIKDTRSSIPANSPSIVIYYCHQARQNLYKPQLMNLYADSALAFFDHENRIKQYPNEYYKALICKGDASLRAQKYITALSYYSKCKNLGYTPTCDDASLTTKIGSIYFGQRNFKLAAQYWAESYS